MLAVLVSPTQTRAWSITSVIAGWFGSSAEKVQAESVSNQNSQTMPLLQATLNPEKPSLLALSDDLNLIDGEALNIESVPVAPEVPDRISVYTVRKGDTLSDIAKMFNVSVNTIKWSNDIKGSIQIDQQLVILPVSGVRHVVKSGDTLKSIANKYNADINEIAQFNGIEINAKLNIGDTFIIPDGEIAPIATSPGSTSSSITKVISNYPKIDSYYARPVAGGVKTQGIHGYNAVDLASYYGAKIYASAPGRVIINKSGGWNGGYGNYIVIAHPNGTQTLYSHLSKNFVEVGQVVDRGETIGLMGNSGKVTGVTGVHLHFEIRGARNSF